VPGVASVGLLRFARLPPVAFAGFPAGSLAGFADFVPLVIRLSMLSAISRSRSLVACW
jgi:hypothetical protein